VCLAVGAEIIIQSDDSRRSIVDGFPIVPWNTPRIVSGEGSNYERQQSPMSGIL
jgi:hypothetical protein